MREVVYTDSKAPAMGNSFITTVVKDFKRNKYKYLMVLPVILYFLLFYYKPMYGAIIAFKNYNPALGFDKSPWVGFKYFIEFFNGIYFFRVMKNTLVISLADIIVGFPAPIILALLLNELRSSSFKRTVQTISYLPYFISMVIVCGLIKDFSASDGVLNSVIRLFGGETTSLLQKPDLFVPIYVISNVWQQIGFGSIIYMAALSAIDQEQYEAAKIDGAGRFRQIWSITLPGIMPTIVILLILRIGNMLNVGFEKIMLLYNPTTYETADVISTYVYRQGLENFSWSFSAAVGLFNSLANFVLLVIANSISKKLNDTSLW